MTFLEMQDLLLVWLDDVDAGYFKRPQIKVWLNNAQKEVQKLIEQAFEGYFEVTKQTTSVQYQREYALPDDFKRLIRFDLILSGTTFQNEDRVRLQKITSSEQDYVSGPTGTPANYYFSGNNIILVPCPDNVWTLRLTYTKRLPDMVNDDDTSEIPAVYHEMLPVLAALDGFNRDGRDPGPMLEKRRYYEEQLKRDAEQRFADASRTVVRTTDDSGFDDGFFGGWM